jgi:NitT/TauT family transport system ATP-binding protein
MNPAQSASSKSEPKLSVRSITKQFTIASGERIEAIADVSFDVLENELCVLLGPSGCGKSTILRMVGGLDSPSRGSLMLDGKKIDRPGRDRGMVFQTYTSFDWLTVQENVEYGLRLNGWTKKERHERAAHFIDLVRLSKFRDAYPKQLSGGMKQRVAIARTLANEPEILLMDEPFGALDAETRWGMQELLMKIMTNSATTVLLVTHDIEEALFLADRIIFMSRHPGRVRENIEVDFKKGQRYSSKEETISLTGYSELDHRIMRMMRQERFLGEEVE